MRFSKHITTYCNTYRLTPQDVFFAILVAAGCGRSESYGCVFNCLALQEGTLKNRAATLVRDKPALAKLIADLINEKTTAPVNAPDWSDYKRKPVKSTAKGSGKDAIEDDINAGWNDEETTAGNLERIIKGELPNLRGKEKIDAALKYGKLLGVDPETAATTHYYLPLTCYNCEFYKREKGKKEGSDS